VHTCNNIGHLPTTASKLPFMKQLGFFVASRLELTPILHRYRACILFILHKRNYQDLHRHRTHSCTNLTLSAFFGKTDS
jgi:hypothetical protein